MMKIIRDLMKITRFQYGNIPFFIKFALSKYI